MALSPRGPLSPRLRERIADGERGYLVFDEDGGSIALRGFLRCAGRSGLEFLVMEHEPRAAHGFRGSAPAGELSQEPMVRLMYVSQAAPGLTEADFDAILREASERNIACGVTGALCLHGDFFGQILEGPEAAVRDLFERIAQDARHREPVVLVEEPCRRRLYGGWAMKGIHGDGAITAADELAARLALVRRDDSVELTRRWLELLQTDDQPTWKDAWLSTQQSVLVMRELIEQSAPRTGAGH